MTVVRHNLKATCSPAKIWALLSDLTAVADYNAQVSAARLRGNTPSGIGAERECDLVPKGRVVERVTVWEDGQALGLKVVESEWPVHFMHWVTHIEDGAPGARVTQELEYRMKFGPVGWLLDRLFMKPMITRNVGATLAAMIERAEQLA